LKVIRAIMMAQHQPVVLDAFGLHHAELKISLLPLCLLLFPGDSVRAVPRRSQILQEEQKTAGAEYAAFNFQPPLLRHLIFFTFPLFYQFV
jgi:hypothetical protein